MALEAYLYPPFNSGSRIDVPDIFTTSGLTNVFALSNLTGLRVGEVLQLGTGFLLRGNGDFTVDNVNNTITLASIPSPGLPLIVPGINTLLIRAFDQAIVPGDGSPRIKEVSFYLANVTDIDWFSHTALPAYGGIRITPTNNDVAFGPPTTWYELAQAIGAGAADTYQAAGSYLEISDISALDFVQGTISAFGTSVTVVDGSQFTLGDVIAVGFRGSNEEEVVITNIVGNVLTTTAFNNPHAIGETVYQCGRKLWLRETVPIDGFGNQPITFVNITQLLECVTEMR